MNDKGYTRIPNAIIRMAVISPSEMRAWCLIASLPEGYGLTVKQASAMLGVNEKTWRWCVAELTRRGMISVEHSPGQANIYRVEGDTKNWDTTPSKNWEYQKLAGVPKIGMTPLPKSGRGTHYNKKKTINNYVDDDAHAHARENFIQNMRSDGSVEQAKIALRISSDEYLEMLEAIAAEWEYQNLPDDEWNARHLISVMRYRVNDKKRNNSNGATIGTNSATGDNPLSRARVHVAHIGGGN